MWAVRKIGREGRVEVYSVKDTLWQALREAERLNEEYAALFPGSEVRFDVAAVEPSRSGK